MSASRIAAIFDVGKTNKKLLLFNEQYELVYESAARLPETVDEDNYPCEDVHALTDWVITGFEQLSLMREYKVSALNFSSYGASFVHLDKTGESCTPIYNYLKPYPPDLKSRFYNKYGGEDSFAVETASPVLDSLNSGMQIYRIKNEQPAIYDKIQHSLHLPQYLSYILSRQAFTDITSVGCHTNLWNFKTNSYHNWVYQEKVDRKFAELVKGNAIAKSNAMVKSNSNQRQLPIGVGLHDSSAALIPYLETFREPFILISTGTWCISMNPFNNDPLTKSELSNDCLCYLTYSGQSIKASRLFAGNDHELQVKRLSEYFHKDDTAVSAVQYNPETYRSLNLNSDIAGSPSVLKNKNAFAARDLDNFIDFETAYHQLIADIMDQQVASTRLVINDNSPRNIFVDGGFSKNEIYMNLLARAFPGIQVSAATIPQSTGLGAALAIHQHWNNQPVPAHLIKVKNYHLQSRDLSY